MSGRSVAVIGASGGCGASLVASGIALAWARSAERVWLADLDIERGDIAGAWDLPAERTLDDLAPVAGELSRAHLTRAAVRGDSGVYVLAAPGRIGAAAPWDEAAASALCRAVTGAGDAVLDVATGVLASAAVAAAGSTLLVCPGSLSAVRRAARIVDGLRRSEAEERLALVVRRARNADVGVRALRRALDLNVVAELPSSEGEARSIAAGTWPSGRRRQLADALQRLAEVLP
jgi:Flp pilus assembly CpaE family ATPase